jgi:SUR7/PalI family
MLFTAAALVMMFLTLLGGANNHEPLNEIYFMQVDTGNIPGAANVSRWTFWNTCTVDSNGKSHCGASHPDYPLDPPSYHNFNTTTNIPSRFVG